MSTGSSYINHNRSDRKMTASENVRVSLKFSSASRYEARVSSEAHIGADHRLSSAGPTE